MFSNLGVPFVKKLPSTNRSTFFFSNFNMIT
jgi:hypothetical protein